MSKTAKAKSRQPSLHSRAARRATSPSLTGNVSQSLKAIPPPTRKQSTTHLFSGSRTSGITKRKKGKQLKRGQLERQRRGAERADTVKGQLDAKLERSLGRLKTIRERRKDWEGINADAERGGGGSGEEGKGLEGTGYAALEEALREPAEAIELEMEVGEIGEQLMRVELPVGRRSEGGQLQSETGGVLATETTTTKKEVDDNGVEKEEEDVVE